MVHSFDSVTGSQTGVSETWRSKSTSKTCSPLLVYILEGWDEEYGRVHP